MSRNYKSACLYFCRSMVSTPSSELATALTAFLLLLLATFGRHVSGATSPFMRCPLPCHCVGNYTSTVVSCANSYLTDVPQLPVGAWKILIKGNNITRLRADSFSELRKLRTVRIYRNNIQSIDENAFKGLSSLDKLYLSEESLSSFENGIFRFFTNLTMLSVRGKLTEVPQREICLLKRLRVLKLALFPFPSARFHPCFEELTELKMLSLSFMEHSNISSATFYPFRASLTEVRVIHCGLRRLHVDMFKDLSKLLILDLSQNDIISLPGSIFAPLSHLSQLNIASNKLRVMSGDLLRPLRFLSQLYIGFNSHLNVTLGEEYLNMTRLQHLVLSGINLTSLNNDTFRHLRHSPLVEVDMSNCYVRAISNGAFQPLRNLTVLTMNNNPLNNSVLRDAFYGLQGLPLRELRLSGVNLHDVSPTLFDGLNDSNITSLTFKSSNIPAIKRGVFSNLRKLTKLDLSSNNIGVFEDNSFEDLKTLSRLDLDRNRIFELRSAKRLGISPGLSFLSAARNVIVYIKEESLLGYDNLTTLLLGGNNIRKISANAFAAIPCLTMLDLSDNKLEYISPGTFDSLPYLQKLVLRRNVIQIRDPSLFQVCQTIYFWMKNNKSCVQ